MPTPAPIVSVLIPVYNAARFLDAAITSVRTQTRSDFELIVVDDGSTDDSPQIALRHAAEDQRLRVLTLPHAGVATALNHGLAAARCRLVARMDADDEALPRRLERQVAAMQARPNLAALGSAMATMNESGDIIGVAHATDDPAAIRDALLHANCLMHPTVMLRRDLVLAAGGYRPIYTAAEDYDLWLRLSEHYELSNLPDVLLRYRGHGNQATGRRWILQRLEVLAAQHAARLRRAGLPDPTGGFVRLDAAALRAMGLPRALIGAALDGQMVSAPPLSTNPPSLWHRLTA